MMHQAAWLNSRVSRTIFVIAALVLLAGGAIFMFAPTGNPVAKDFSTLPEPESSVAADLRLKIDDWIASKGLNRYGDPRGTHYAGGTPLFDEQTGKLRDRYEYILEKHPELRAAKGGK